MFLVGKWLDSVGGNIWVELDRVDSVGGVNWCRSSALDWIRTVSWSNFGSRVSLVKEVSDLGFGV